MPGLRSTSGQLLLPAIAVLFMFGLFWITYVHWCRTTYWEMRMDIVSDLVALSVAREQASILNTMATVQLLENGPLQKLAFGDVRVAHMQVNAWRTFEALNQLLTMTHASYIPRALDVARRVAKANGANRPPLPLSPLRSDLKGQSVQAVIVHVALPVMTRRYRNAYFVRTWFPRKVKAQPPHRTVWSVCHDGICGTGRARLWLDVKPGDVLNNGGFPQENPSFWRGAGIQCFYPQFNARRVPKQ